MAPKTLFVKDIFYSFQGEGPYIGQPQLFIRFYGCNIHCDYCDEPDFTKDKKKWNDEELLKEISTFSDKHIHSVSITGGEPLMYAEGLAALLPQIPYNIYLETNATLPRKLDLIKDLVTTFALDYKPGYETPFLESLAIVKKKDVFVKFILCPDSTDQQLAFAASAVAGTDIPLILQPVTPFADVHESVSPERIYSAHKVACALHDDVRIIPQTHKYLSLK